MSTRADELEKRVEAGFAELRERTKGLGASWGPAFAGTLAYLDDSVKQFIAATQGTPFNELAVAVLMQIDAIKRLIQALPEEMRQCSECGLWLPFDDVCKSYQPRGGRLYEQLCGECASNLEREYGEDN